jgi:hypothetical protein
MRLAGIIISLAMLIVASEARDRGQFAKSTPEMKAVRQLEERHGGVKLAIPVRTPG